MQNTSQGFTLLEVLIAFVILVVGILGASTLVMRSAQVNMNAYETQQVTLIANTIIEKMRAYPANADKYRTLSAAEKDCSNSDCSIDDIIKSELFTLDKQLADTKLPDIKKEIKKVSGAGMVMGSDRNTHYLLTITWGGAKDDSANSYSVDFVVANPEETKPTP